MGLSENGEFTMKVLITGGLGFIGSNFILRFEKKYPNWKIINLDAELQGSNKKNLVLMRKNPNYQYVKGNIQNRKLVESLVAKVDLVINFAAESHVDRSINEPKPFINSNILGVYTLLEAIRKFDKKFVHISTDEVFGSLISGSADEKSPFNPSSPYASSKASAELIINSYVATYGCKAIITRCTNNYGARQSPEKLIPKIILLAYNKKKIPIYGTGKNIRDWIYVDDHCDAIIRIIQKGVFGKSYNISAKNELDNITIVKTILQLMGRSKDLIKFTKDRPGHDFRYSLNSSKIRRELGWKPKHAFRDGIKETISWYIQNKQWWSKMNISNLNKIQWKTR